MQVSNKYKTRTTKGLLGRTFLTTGLVMVAVYAIGQVKSPSSASSPAAVQAPGGADPAKIQPAIRYLVDEVMILEPGRPTYSVGDAAIVGSIPAVEGLPLWIKLDASEVRIDDFRAGVADTRLQVGVAISPRYGAKTFDQAAFAGEFSLAVVDGTAVQANPAEIMLSDETRLLLQSEFDLWLRLTANFRGQVSIQQILTCCALQDVSGDLDGDGDLDMDDIALFDRCLTGPGGTMDVGCKFTDMDHDHDADLVDFGLLQVHYPHVPGGGNGNMNDNANGNDNANDNGNANDNDNGNKNDNANGNGNDNANGNKNDNANGNLNDNGNKNDNTNGNANDNANGNKNDNANGNKNDNANGNLNDNANGNKNDNDNDNGNVNDNTNGNKNDNANDNGNLNDNGNKNDNANGNANANANGNLNDNANGNKNDNANGNKNDNANDNGNANDNANGNKNDNANGNKNDNANGNVNDNTNGNANANDNGNVNGNGNANDNGNLNDNANGNVNDNANGNLNDNANGNENDNTNGNVNDNTNGNLNDNANGNVNDNANGNVNDNANGNVNGNDNGNQTCPDGSLRLRTDLAGAGPQTGDAEYRLEPGRERFRVDVDGFARANYTVTVDGVNVGIINVGSNGSGRLEYDNNLPANFPNVGAGSVVSVAGVISGTFALDCN